MKKEHYYVITILVIMFFVVPKFLPHNGFVAEYYDDKGKIIGTQKIVFGNTMSVETINSPVYDIPENTYSIKLQALITNQGNIPGTFVSSDNNIDITTINLLQSDGTFGPTNSLIIGPGSTGSFFTEQVIVDNVPRMINKKLELQIVGNYLVGQEQVPQSITKVYDYNFRKLTSCNTFSGLITGTDFDGCSVGTSYSVDYYPKDNYCNTCLGQHKVWKGNTFYTGGSNYDNACGSPCKTYLGESTKPNLCLSMVTNTLASGRYIEYWQGKSVTELFWDYQTYVSGGQDQSTDPYADNDWINCQVHMGLANQIRLGTYNGWDNYYAGGSQKINPEKKQSVFLLEIPSGGYVNRPKTFFIKNTDSSVNSFCRECLGIIINKVSDPFNNQQVVINTFRDLVFWDNIINDPLTPSRGRDKAQLCKSASISCEVTYV